MEMQCQEVTSYFAAEAPPQRGAAPQVSIYMEPPYGIYNCASGYLAIAQADLAVLGPALGLPELADLKLARPRQADTPALTAWRDRIVALIAGRLTDRSASDWDNVLAPLGIWCQVVNDYAAFLDHPQAATALVEMDHPAAGRYRTVAPGIRFSGQATPPLTTAPAYGADSRAILAEAGLAPAEIESLVHAGTVVAS
jgi:crotonobetainyl-CoA:carnitine CoA-transferase CaiB-like acyl-CoA transferase